MMAAPGAEQGPGNPLGPGGGGAKGPIPAPGKPGPENGAGAPMQGISEAGQQGQQAPQGPPPVDAGTAEAITRLAAAVEGQSAEIEQLRRRARSMERQVIMLFGVLALIAYRVGSQKLKGVTDGIAPSPIPE